VTLMIDPKRSAFSRRSARHALLGDGCESLAACGPGAAPPAPDLSAGCPPTAAAVKPAATTAAADGRRDDVSTARTRGQQALKNRWHAALGQVGDLVTIDAIM